AFVVRWDDELLQGELSAAAVQGGDLPAGEVPGLDDPRPRRSVLDARHAQRHLALAGKRPDAGDGAESGPLGPPSVRRLSTFPKAEGLEHGAGNYLAKSLSAWELQL